MRLLAVLAGSSGPGPVLDLAAVAAVGLLTFAAGFVAVRPFVNRRHLRLVGATAEDLRRLAGESPRRAGAAVTVVPGALGGQEDEGRAPFTGLAAQEFDDEHPFSTPGRHRAPPMRLPRFVRPAPVLVPGLLLTDGPAVTDEPADPGASAGPRTGIAVSDDAADDGQLQPAGDSASEPVGADPALWERLSREPSIDQAPDEPGELVAPVIGAALTAAPGRRRFTMTWRPGPRPAAQSESFAAARATSVLPAAGRWARAAAATPTGSAPGLDGPPDERPAALTPAPVSRNEDRAALGRGSAWDWRSAQTEDEAQVGQPGPDDNRPLRSDPTVPDPTVPDATVPDATVPDPTVPDTTLPDATPAEPGRRDLSPRSSWLLAASVPEASWSVPAERGVTQTAMDPPPTQDDPLVADDPQHRAFVGDDPASGVELPAGPWPVELLEPADEPHAADREAGREVDDADRRHLDTLALGADFGTSHRAGEPEVDSADLGGDEDVDDGEAAQGPGVAAVDAMQLLPSPRHPRTPSVEQLRQLKAVSDRLTSLGDRVEMARACAESGRPLVEADVVGLVVRSVEGPRVLWQEPGGQDVVQTWGPQTLAALLSCGTVVRTVLDGDPLSAGAPTALLTAPVPAAGTMIGVLVARRAGARGFSPVDEDLLGRLARMTGASLGLSGRRGVVGGIGADPASGLPTRDRLMSDIRAALRTAPSHGMPVTLVAASVDGLQAVRADRGPACADRILADLVEMLTELLRIGDLAYRFGADELAVLLPATEPDGAQVVADRLTAQVEASAERFSPLTQGIRLSLRAGVVPVTGVAEDVVFHAVRVMAAAARRSAASH